MTDENVYPYLLASSYGVIGDCRSAAIISSNGALDWGSLPDFDSPAIFCRLLDARRGGYFQIAPSDTTITGSQHYLQRSNVLQTTFASDAGKVVLTDFMPVESLDGWSSLEPPYHTLVDGDSFRQCLVRIVDCTDGELPITLTLKVGPNYGGIPSESYLVSENKGVVISGENQSVGLAIIGAYRLSSFTMHVSQDEMELYPTVKVQTTLREGEHLQFILGIRPDAQDARRMVEIDLQQRNFDWELAHTLYCWRRWVARCNYGEPCLDGIQRTALMLKLLLNSSKVTGR